MLNLTHSCNLKCRYCFVHQNPETMTLETAKKAVKFILENKNVDIPSINFFGGEPTICWDSVIVPLVEWVRDELKVLFTFGMTTNGTLLNDERMDWMKKYDVGMLFSIDGDKETQDYNRSDSFDLIANKIDRIAKDFNPTFRSTVIPPTCHNVFHNIEFAIEHGFKSFFIVPNTYEEWEEDKWNILKQEVRKYSDYYINCYKNGEIPITFSLIENSFKDIKRINNSITNNIFRNCSCTRCGLGCGGYVSIHPNGNIYGCQEMTSSDDNVFLIGDIYRGLDEKKIENLKSLYKPEDIEGDDCKHCKLNRICNGSCIANNYIINEDINKVPKTQCMWNRFVLDESIYIANQLGDCDAFIKHWRESNG